MEDVVSEAGQSEMTNVQQMQKSRKVFKVFFGSMCLFDLTSKLLSSIL